MDEAHDFSSPDLQSFNSGLLSNNNNNNNKRLFWQNLFTDIKETKPVYTIMYVIRT